MRIIPILITLLILPAGSTWATTPDTEGLYLSGSAWQAVINPETGALLRYTRQTDHGSWCIPFRTGSHTGPTFENVILRPSEHNPYLFSGTRGDLHYDLHYREEKDHLCIECRISNQTAKTLHVSRRERLILGVDCEMRHFPDWDEKLFPALIRCEKDFAWGYFMSPQGRILAFGVEEPVASYGLNYIFEGNKAWLWGHQIYTASLDLLHTLPLPARHPQHLTKLAPGESRCWTIHLGVVNKLEHVKPLVAAWIAAPLLDARKYTLCAGEQASVKVYGTLPVTNVSIHTPDGKQEQLDCPDGKHIISPPLNRKGIYHLAVTAGNKQAEASFYVREPWSWYLRRARDFIAEHPPFFSASCETFYSYYTAFLATRHFPDAKRDSLLQKRFSKGLSQMILEDGSPRAQANPRRIQNFSTLVGILVDLWEATRTDRWLKTASRLGDYIASDSVQWSDGSYRSGTTHYTAVIYPVKSMFELADAELQAGWTDRAQRHYQSAMRAAEDLRLRLDNIETEGDMTFEDGMISCSALQMALCGLHMPDSEQRKTYADAARYMMEKHRCLEQLLIPDCRMRGATLRYWEALDVYFSSNQVMNSPHGWTAWKIYAVCYLYLLTGEEHYLNEMMETLGCCVQLLDSEGRLRWGFLPDPYIEGVVCTPVANNPHKRQMRDSIVGEQYLGMISSWFRPADEEEFTHFGGPGGAGDNTVHEIFKALEECVLTTVYVIIDESGNVRCHNGSAQWLESGRLLILPDEACAARIHLNTARDVSIETTLHGKAIRKRMKSGMAWIGENPYPEIRF